MFEGGYYADIILHELKGNPYSKKWLRFKHRLGNVVVLLLAAAVIYFWGNK